uniref:Uncharacterized protein n=1 Tax=Arundo donax TaxID=35708 RepID=A0A0A9DK22_ARUDO
MVILILKFVLSPCQSMNVHIVIYYFQLTTSYIGFFFWTL